VDTRGTNELYARPPKMFASLVADGRQSDRDYIRSGSSSANAGTASDHRTAAPQWTAAFENRLSTTTPTTMRAMPAIAPASSFWPRNNQPIAAISVTPTPDQTA